MNKATMELALDIIDDYSRPEFNEKQAHTGLQAHLPKLTLAQREEAIKQWLKEMKEAEDNLTLP